MENYPLIVNLVFDFCYLWSVSDLHLSLYYQGAEKSSFLRPGITNCMISLLLTFGCRGHIFRLFFSFSLIDYI